MGSALLALTAFGVQVGYGAPTRSVQIARALSCCATRCRHPKSPGAAARCCGVEGQQTDLTASTQTSARDDRPVLQSVLAQPDVRSELAGPRLARPAPAPATRARGAPLFLLTHSLRN